MLTINKVFTILCLLCLCVNREHPGSFQNKSVRSSFKWVLKYIMFLAKLKGEVRPFQESSSMYSSSKLPLHVRVMLTTTKGSIIQFLGTLPVGIGNTLWQFSKQISKIFFQLSVQVHFLLDQTEKERKAFLGGCKKGATLGYSRKILNRGTHDPCKFHMSFS